MTQDLEKEYLNKENGLKLIEVNEQLKAEKQQSLKEVNYKLVDLSDKYLKIVDELTESEDEAALEAFKKRKHQFMALDREGRDVFLADSGYVLQMAQTDFPKIKFHFTSEF